MGQIFISAGHGGFENGIRDVGTVVPGTTESQEMIQLRDLILPELRARGFDVLSVPDDLSLSQSIIWINSRARSGAIALEIHADAFRSSSIRGASVYHISQNLERKGQAELLLLALLRRVPQLPSRGVKSDTQTGMGRLAFCRQVAPASLLMQVGYLSNVSDRQLLQSRRRDFALGIADGLASWSRSITGVAESAADSSGQVAATSTTSRQVEENALPVINIQLNGGKYDEQGILISNNSYVPVDLADRLGIDLAEKTDLRRVRYRNVVYIKAVDFREFDVKVGWEASTRTVTFQSPAKSTLGPCRIDRIMGLGVTTVPNMIMFLNKNNKDSQRKFPDIARLYLDEAREEGVNHDIAFAQMCVETDFLQFGGDVKPTQNNFAGLGAVGSAIGGASFASARLGVQAHIQHLKAYASTEPLVNNPDDPVDPRFQFVVRGIAPFVKDLSNRWASDPNYGEKILAMLRRLYESVGYL